MPRASGPRLGRIRSGISQGRGVGTVALIVLPALPRDAPMPSAELMQALRRYLEPLKTLCTRLVITGPSMSWWSVAFELSAQRERRKFRCANGSSQRWAISFIR